MFRETARSVVAVPDGSRARARGQDIQPAVRVHIGHVDVFRAAADGYSGGQGITGHPAIGHQRARGPPQDQEILAPIVVQIRQHDTGVPPRTVVDQDFGTSEETRSGLAVDGNPPIRLIDANGIQIPVSVPIGQVHGPGTGESVLAQNVVVLVDSLGSQAIDDDASMGSGIQQPFRKAVLVDIRGQQR